MSDSHRCQLCSAAALKRAVHGGQPGSYGGYVITKLMERLHAAKHWLVRHGPLLVCAAARMARSLSHVLDGIWSIRCA